VQLALAYVAATFLVGTLAVAAGAALGQRVWPGP
jgi:CrcB protein